jgi:hypothetical protein
VATNVISTMVVRRIYQLTVLMSEFIGSLVMDVLIDIVDDLSLSRSEIRWHVYDNMIPVSV